MNDETDASDVTQEEFDEALADLVHEMSADCILGIPGVYEAISEYLNNEVIDRARENREIARQRD